VVDHALSLCGNWRSNEPKGSVTVSSEDLREGGQKSHEGKGVGIACHIWANWGYTENSGNGKNKTGGGACTRNMSLERNLKPFLQKKPKKAVMTLRAQS